MTRMGLGRRAAALGMALALVTLVACGGDDDDDDSAGGSGGGQTAGEVTVRAINDPSDVTIAVLMYLPQSITVTQGTTVSWALTGPEPHSVTFFPAGQTPPPPGSDDSLFAPRPPAGGAHDANALINSGLVPFGPGPAQPFKLRFDTPGKYTYYCVIHPLMTGTVDVVASGGDADTQAEITSRGDTELRQWTAEGQDAKRRLTGAPPVSTRNADGTTTWTVEMGATTAHTDILYFAPVSASIKPGDRVTFVNNSQAPHTATFAGRQAAPQDPTAPEATQPRPGPSPQTLNATDLFGTGTLPPNAPPGAGPPLAVRSYTYVVPAAGDYAYVCVYHATSGMSGLVKVA